MFQTIIMMTHDFYMQKAINQAQIAFASGEIPIGAVIVCRDKIIGQGYNMTEKLNDATAHAEMLAISAASEYLSDRHLHDCVLYVTLKPCQMCMGAVFWSQIKSVIYGAEDRKDFAKRGGVNIVNISSLGGVICRDSEQLIDNFFSEIRSRR